MAERIIAIHQPQYLPWIPYVDKILRSDAFVFLDNVQFQKNGLQNRNQIKTACGPAWITVPIRHAFGQVIRDVTIADPGALRKHARTLEQNYRKGQFFEEVYCLLTPILGMETTSLCELNEAIIRGLLGYLSYGGEILKASELTVDGKGSDLILNICRAVNATTYLSGIGGKNYMRMEEFERAGISVLFHSYINREYPQLFSQQGFMPDLSVVDLLFNMGPGSRAVIEDGRAN